MKSIQLEIPDNLANEINAVAKDESVFILTAITEKLHQHQFHELLAEGYAATREEDLELTKNFEPADFEHWT